MAPSALVWTTCSLMSGFSIAGEVNQSAVTDVVNHPRGCIAVHQEKDGSIHFEVFLIQKSRLVPIEAYRLSVDIPGQRIPVWWTEGKGYALAHVVTYGVVPEGFHHRIPPEQLVPGVKYRVSVRSYSVGGIQRVFVRDGAAKSHTCPWDGNPER